MNNAARLLDAEVAEKVMNHFWIHYGGKAEHTCEGYIESFLVSPSDWERLFGEPQYKKGKVKRWCIKNFTPRYSTDLVAAFQVVEKMQQILGDYSFKLTWASEAESDKWYAAWERPNRVFAHADITAPIAICKAALKALE